MYGKNRELACRSHYIATRHYNNCPTNFRLPFNYSQKHPVHKSVSIYLHHIFRRSCIQENNSEREFILVCIFDKVASHLNWRSANQQQILTPHGKGFFRSFKMSSTRCFRKSGVLQYLVGNLIGCIYNSFVIKKSASRHKQARATRSTVRCRSPENNPRKQPIASNFWSKNHLCSQ